MKLFSFSNSCSSHTPNSNSEITNSEFTNEESFETPSEAMDTNSSHQIHTGIYGPVSQGAKMYDVISKALKKDHMYMEKAVQEVIIK